MTRLAWRLLQRSYAREGRLDTFTIGGMVGWGCDSPLERHEKKG